MTRKHINIIRQSAKMYALVVLFFAATAISSAIASRPTDTTTHLFSLTYSDANGNDGIVHLRWSNSGFSDSTIFIVQRFDGGWKDIDIFYGNSKDTYITKDDSVYACGDSLKYRIIAGILKITDATVVPNITDTSWLGISDTKTLYVQDAFPPEFVSLDSVSTGADNRVYYGWKKSTSKDAYGYLVMKQSGGLLQEFARTYDTHFDTMLGKTEALALEFKVKVFDLCNNQSSISDGLFVSATDVIYQGCEDKVTIKYAAAGSSVLASDKLLLYGLRQDGKFEQVAEVPYSLNYTFSLSSTDAVSYVAFKVKTLNSATGISASAYIDSFSVLPPPIPRELHITSVSVNEDGTVDILPVVDTAIPFGSVDLYRSSDNSTFEKKISWKTVPNVWTDNTTNASTTKYSYYGIISDTCGRAAHKSEVHTTMLLKAVVAGENTFRLSWNVYEDWSSGVKTYRIFTLDEILIDSVPQAGNYDLKVTSIESAIGQKYFVEAVKATTLTDTTPATSRSNIITLETADMPEVFMPTGFVPNGLTKIYKPVGRLNGIEDYDFRIYDITGKLVFKSNNPEIGWDGNSASPSNYFYRISFKKGEQMFEKTGTVTVVK